MGKADRIIRAILAFTAIILYTTHIVTGTWGIILIVFSGVFLLTSLISICPLYTLLGISTCSRR